MQRHRVLNKSGSRRLTAGSRLLTIWGLLPRVLGHAAHKIYLKGSFSEMPFRAFFSRYVQSNMLVGWLSKLVLVVDCISAQPAECVFVECQNGF